MGLKALENTLSAPPTEAHFKSLPCFLESRVQDLDRPQRALDPPDKFAQI